MHGLLSESLATCQDKLRPSLLSTARKILNNLAKLGICISQWAIYKRNTEVR